MSWWPPGGAKRAKQAVKAVRLRRKSLKKRGLIAAPAPPLGYLQQGDGESKQYILEIERGRP